jgi:hypothetical protein
LKQPGEQPLTFVTLAQIPYTGVELGPVQTALYWTTLIILSLLFAYFFLFGIVPFARRRLAFVGATIRDAVNEETISEKEPPRIVEERIVQNAPRKEPISLAQTLAAEPITNLGFDRNLGFRSFQTGEKSLSIDDIVQGLSRISHVEERADEINPPRGGETPRMSYAPVREVAAARPAPRIDYPTLEQNGDNVIRFVQALMRGDAASVFGQLRREGKSGGEQQRFLTGVVVALDDVHRARTLGEERGSDVERVCAMCDTSLLEEIVSTLTRAVDSTYAATDTGVKAALMRVLSVVGR